LYQGIEMLNAAKRRRNTLYPTLNLSFTITDENYGHILEFLRQVEPLRPDHINISQMNFITEAMAAAHNARYGGELAVVRSNLGAMEPADFDTAAIAAELARVRAYAAARGPDFPALSIVPDSADPIRLETYYREPNVFVGGRQCTDPWKMLMVKTDGTVIPSHGRCYNVPVGNVRETPLVELWNSPRFVAFRKTLQAAGGTLPACARCCGIIGKKAPPPPAPPPQGEGSETSTFTLIPNPSPSKGEGSQTDTLAPLLPLPSEERATGVARAVPNRFGIRRPLQWGRGVGQGIAPCLTYC